MRSSPLIIKHSEPYGPLRRKEYPDYGEQLDAIYKMALALKEQGIELPVDTVNWIERCKAVKDKYKKV